MDLCLSFGMRCQELMWKDKSQSISTNLFFPPDLNTAMINNATEVLSKDLHYDDMKHVWFDIYRGNRSIENDIIGRTSNEIELLKTGLIPKEIHMSMWGSFGVLVIVLMVLTFVCWRKNRKSKTVYISTVL